MHYADGTPAKHGDLVINRPSWKGAPHQVGIITYATAAADRCNAQIKVIATRPAPDADLPGAAWIPTSFDAACVTLKECSLLIPQEAAATAQVQFDEETLG